MARRSRYDPIVPEATAEDAKGARIDVKVEADAQGAPKPSLPIVPFMPWQQPGGQDVRGLVEPARQDLDRKLHAELEKLEQAFAAKLEAVERHAQETQAEAARVRAETERLRNDPVHSLVDQLRAQVSSLQ